MYGDEKDAVKEKYTGRNELEKNRKNNHMKRQYRELIADKYKKR